MRINITLSKKVLEKVLEVSGKDAKGELFYHCINVENGCPLRGTMDQIAAHLKDRCWYGPIGGEFPIDRHGKAIVNLSMLKMIYALRSL